MVFLQSLFGSVFLLTGKKAKLLKELAYIFRIYSMIQSIALKGRRWESSTSYGGWWRCKVSDSPGEAGGRNLWPYGMGFSVEGKVCCTHSLQTGGAALTRGIPEAVQINGGGGRRVVRPEGETEDWE